MGFRGEAIPSIASVSNFHLITKTPNDSTATEIIFSGGRLDTMQKVAAKDGTTITVKNLFYNVPARRKFLKTEPIEYKHILNYLHYQSILFPHISFTLFHNNKEKFNYPATNSIAHRMLDIFGTSFNNQRFIYFTKEAPIIRLSGYLQDIDQYDQNSLLDAHYIFVNRRYINDKTVYSAIKTAYEPFLKKYRFFESGKLPNYMLFIDINPEEIDVNVHPAKTEIRFRNTGAVYQFVKDSVFECLQNNEFKRYEETKAKISTVPLAAPLTPREEQRAREIYRVDSGQWTVDSPPPVQQGEGFPPPPEGVWGWSGREENSTLHTPHSTLSKISIKDLEKNIQPINPKTNSQHIVAAELASVPLCSPSPSVAAELASVLPNCMGEHRGTVASTAATEGRGWDAIKNPHEYNTKYNQDHSAILKTLKEDFIPPWQLHNTYIFIQTADGFVVIDQHAAHERILYEKLLKNIDTKKPNKQKLVFPLVIDLPSYLAENIMELIEANTDTLDSLGFTVKSFSGNSLVIDEIPAEIGFWDGGNIFIEILEQLQDELTQTKDFRIASAASVACKAAIKAGKKLSKREMHELITELFNCDFPFQCPHGRPLIIKMTLTEIERLFKRIV
jgi:DNA mismatch repair protein MutL